jgi:hypothetical protein
MGHVNSGEVIGIVYATVRRRVQGHIVGTAGGIYRTPRSARQVSDAG